MDLDLVYVFFLLNQLHVLKIPHVTQGIETLNSNQPQIKMTKFYTCGPLPLVRILLSVFPL